MKPTRRFAIAAALTAVCYLGPLSATERPRAARLRLRIPITLYPSRQSIPSG